MTRNCVPFHLSGLFTALALVAGCGAPVSELPANPGAARTGDAEASKWQAAAIPKETASPVKTMTDDQYPDNPNIESRSALHGKYAHGEIKVHHKEGTVFDLEFTSGNAESSTVWIRNADLSVFTPKVPSWVKDPYLRKVGLQNQEWNRVQMRFDVGERLEATDAAEKAVLTRADVANNCLAAGLWEVSFFTKENGEDLPYFQAWFDFPADAYAAMYEQVNGTAWADEKAMLAEWKDLPSEKVALEALREPGPDQALAFVSHTDKLPPLTGERKKKKKNVLFPTSVDAVTDYQTNETAFATFSSPGMYRKDDPRKTSLGRFAKLESVVARQVKPGGGPAASVHELELTYSSATGEKTRLLIGGLELAALPKLPLDQHHKGFQMPMGLGNHTFYSKYDEGKARSPDNAWYAMLLDGEGRWLDSHTIGIDGPLVYWDDKTPDRLHLMLLSFERHAIVEHVELPVILTPAS